MSAAQLPQHLIQGETVRDMKVGDVRYITPWSMMVDHDMRCWLNGKSDTESSRSGTVSMRIERKSDGYHVFATETGQKYAAEGQIPWVGVETPDLIPVQAVR